MSDVWRRYWPLHLVTIGFFVVVVIFASYLSARQRIADDRVERQRAAICAILANIPGHIPTEIAHARVVFARPGHPGDCRVPASPRPTSFPHGNSEAPVGTLSIR